MSRILVVGNLNVETTLRVEAFPIPYRSATFVPFGIDSAVSGIGYNLARALTALGDDVVLAALLGRDRTAALIRAQLRDDGISDRYIPGQVEQTPLSVIAYDASGRRTAFADIKDMMQQTYPAELFAEALESVEAALFTPVPYCRPLLAPARAAGKLVAADVQLIAGLDDPTRQPYLESAQVVFMSGELLPEAPEAWARHLLSRYTAVEVVGIGLGAEGALLAVRETGRIERIPAIVTRPVVNTGGAGDALFAAFMHFYTAARDAAAAMRRAMTFASYKIGETGSSRGFLDAAGLEELYSSLREQGAVTE